LNAKAKEVLQADKTKKARAVILLLLKAAELEFPGALLPKPDNVGQNVNHTRSIKIPKNPNEYSLDFDVDHSGIEPWVYTIVRKPLQVLFTIHVCLKKGNCSKQVPVRFAIMSHCTLDAYTALFFSINKLFEREKLGPPKVIQMMLKFEKAAGKALKSIYIGVDLVGCFFHWCQAVRKRMDQEGQAKFTTSKFHSPHQFIKRILSQ
jgi:hypothetical protein